MSAFLSHKLDINGLIPIILIKFYLCFVTIYCDITYYNVTFKQHKGQLHIIMSLLSYIFTLIW